MMRHAKAQLCEALTPNPCQIPNLKRNSTLRIVEKDEQNTSLSSMKMYEGCAGCAERAVHKLFG